MHSINLMQQMLQSQPQKESAFWGKEPMIHPENKKHEGPIANLLEGLIAKEELNLPEGYEWDLVEGNKEDLDAETIEFVAKHFFSLKNTTLLTADYLDWFLQRKELSMSLLIRIKQTGKLAGMISANPLTVNARDSLIDGVQV